MWRELMQRRNDGYRDRKGGYRSVSAATPVVYVLPTTRPGRRHPRDTTKTGDTFQTARSQAAWEASFGLVPAAGCTAPVAGTGISVSSRR